MKNTNHLQTSLLIPQLKRTFQQTSTAKPYWLSLIFASTLVACGSQDDQQTFAEPLPEVVDFNFHVKPILSDTCYLCHGLDETNAKGGLSLASYDKATSHKTAEGKMALIPGNPEDSEIWQRILSDDENTIMPPPSSNLVLSDREKAIIKKWIEQGAEYKKHWALIKPERAKTPTVSKVDWVNNDIDNFILKQIEAKGLTPQSPADKESLIRRASFDLTGLPPTLSEIDEFLADDSANAYEKLIDRLLAKPSFGERLATEWMDVARYADTHGYSTDFYRDMSPYRDWVIDSFNQNRPFDEFITWQVAGDLLPNATTEQRLATAFNRIHAQNGEGGIVAEEFRVEYVKDRVQTIGTGLLGLTMHCAQCHDHKYDPISAKDYYSTFAFFNNIDDSGQISYDPNDIPVPTLRLPNAEQEKQLTSLEAEIAKQSQLINQTHSLNNAEFKKWLAKDPSLDKITGDDALIAYYPFSKKDSVKSIAEVKNQDLAGKVIWGAQPNEKNGPDMVHEISEGRQAIVLNGDDALYFPKLNDFDRARPFSVSIDVKLPDDLEEGVLVHYNKAGVLYNFKGFDFGLENNQWIVRLAHTAPYNAIILKSQQTVQRNKWLNVTMTYDGSSKAAGTKFFVNGQEIAMTVERDNLYKDIKHTKEGVLKEIGIKVGARWRSRGLKGAVVDNLKVYQRDLTAIEIANANQVQAPSKSEALLALFNSQYNKRYQQDVAKLTQLRQQQNSLAETIKEIMVMEELPEPRQAYILERGSYASHGEPVQPGVPERVFPYDPSWGNQRDGLAKWLTHPDHPLVSRVVINRYWQMMFGTGLVRTPEDFGNQGQLPTHPELLDWLAREFVASGWNVKHMLKLMAMSQTYRQSSIADAQLTEIDPENRLYARGPKARLTAEMIRDNALAASGLLVDKLGGESVKPYQPKDIWKMNNMEYKQGAGEELYRRSMYTIHKRSAPPPNMTAFDAPMRSYSVGTRQQTSTPLQALALLNDPQIVEASRVLASKVMQQTTDKTAQLRTIYRTLTSRKISDDELAIVEQMYQDMLSSFANKSEQSHELLAIGEAQVTGDNIQAEQLAALTSITNILINHDATVIKR
ncbi:hypothetical protein C2869_17225 [Saccharobesus litoralis]|uniref:Planctomycete cytochrome C n=1 Tax=Saccharobesus litoralis TaxID=2172099 RepID=A0A2S0VV31_9ALTE|nr:DUF1553 domain-containing protein [Saccharobesus litoralis]AWB68055.1 hypothetical protein C2869_17225 [Saccharobesus litoralis]